MWGTSHLAPRITTEMSALVFSVAVIGSVARIW